MGMDNIRSGTSDTKTHDHKSGWTTPHESNSTVGFARLQDEEAYLSPVDVQKSVYGPTMGATPIGSAVTTDTVVEAPTRSPSVSQGIVKNTTIDQRTDPR